MKRKVFLIPALAVSLPLVAQAQISITGGMTNLAANFTKLGTDAGLAANFGASQGTAFAQTGFTIAFQITPGTDFTYDPVANFAAFDPVAGTLLSHASIPGVDPAIAFNRTDNNELISTGDLNIGFDDTRQGSGFYIEDASGDFGLILFDFATPAPSDFSATSNGLFVESDLLFAPEFAAFLQTEGLAASDLTGDSVGLAQVDAVPEPATFGGVIGLVALGAVLLRRRRRD